MKAVLGFGHNTFNCWQPHQPTLLLTNTTPPHTHIHTTKLQELAVASREAEALLRSISESTAVAEKEKAKVAVIVGEVSSKAAEIAAVKVRMKTCSVAVC